MLSIPLAWCAPPPSATSTIDLDGDGDVQTELKQLRATRLWRVRAGVPQPLCFRWEVILGFSRAQKAMLRRIAGFPKEQEPGAGGSPREVGVSNCSHPVLLHHYSDWEKNVLWV